MNRHLTLHILIKLLLAAFILVGIAACDDDKPTVVIDNFGIITGTVYSPAKGALPDVTVSVGDKSTISDFQGKFTLSGIAPGASVIVSFSRADFIGNHKVVKVEKARTTYISSTLFTPTTQSFPSDMPAYISDGGTSIVIPPNAFVTAQGSPFSGSVYSEMKYFDPTLPACLDAFPGSFTGIQTNGTETMFESYGFFSARFFDAANLSSELQLGSGQTATISAMIPSSLQADAPASIPMWYFDEDTGKWMEQGVATKNGMYYEGSVSHFTYWNFDAPITIEDQSTLTGRVMSGSRAEPVFGAQVVATGVNYSGYTRVYSDANGNFSISVKASAQVRIRAYLGLNYSDETSVINTPASGGSQAIGDLYIEDRDFIFMGRLVNATGQPVSGGYGMISQINPPSGDEALSAWLNLEDDGTFSVYAAYMGTATNITVQFSLYQRNQLFSNPITIPVPLPGQIKDFGDVTMRPGGTITARVKDNNGNWLSSTWISFSQEGSTGEGSHYSGEIDDQGYMSMQGPPNTTLNNMRGQVYISEMTYQTNLMSLSFPASGATRNIGTITVNPLE